MEIREIIDNYDITTAFNMQCALQRRVRQVKLKETNMFTHCLVIDVIGAKEILHTKIQVDDRVNLLFFLN